MIQQASNFLINTRAKGFSAFNGVSPLGSADFFKNGDQIKSSKWAWKTSECAIKPDSEFFMTEDNSKAQIKFFFRFVENFRLDLRASLGEEL